jgi:radical SAM-linked protein
VARKPEGPPPPPAVQRLRVHYAKRGRLRFSSHRDFQRAFERALRRAGVPMAYSAGFSPHPKVSYAGAAPTGTASEAEYLEIAVAQRCDPQRLREALDAALPPDLDVLEVVEVAAGRGGLAERLEASVWEIRLPGVTPDRARDAAATFLATPEVEVARMTKNGLRTFDARAAVARLDVVEDPAGGRVTGAAGRAGTADDTSCAILRLVVQHVTPAVRPDDVLAGLRQVSDLAPPVTPAVTRLAQGRNDERHGTVSDPLAPDRDSAGA